MTAMQERLVQWLRLTLPAMITRSARPVTTFATPDEIARRTGIPEGRSGMMPSARGLVHDNDAEQGVPGAQLMWSACCAHKPVWSILRCLTSQVAGVEVGVERHT